MKLIPPNITPGPWTNESFQAENNVEQIWGGLNNDALICIVLNPSDPRRKANTAAIKALPQCHKALVSVWHLLRKTGDYSTQEYYQVSEALLAAGYKIEQ